MADCVSCVDEFQRRRNIDLDDLCGYSTVRRVKIRDRRLGALYYLCICITLAYVIGYSTLWQQLYRKLGNIQGNVALTLESPERQYVAFPNSTGYCSFPNGPAAGDRVSGGPSFNRLPCHYVDGYDAVWPGTEAGALFIATRTTVSNSSMPPGCTRQTDPDCGYRPITSASGTANYSYYTAAIPFFKLRIGHVITVPDLADEGLSQASVSMKDGCITKGTDCREGDGFVDPCAFYTDKGLECPPDIGVGITGHTDKISLGTLLSAAGVTSLDEAAGDASVQSDLSGQTLRNSGFTVLVTIVYSNYYEQTRVFDQQTLVYRYKVTRVKNEAFSGTQVLPGPGSEAAVRTLLERHGIRIVVKQSGTVGAFDVFVMLVSLTTSLSLLAVSKIAVDIMATYCLPFRHVYKQYMKVRTVDFSDLEGLGPALLNRFRYEDLVNWPPAVFGRVDMEGHIHETVITGSMEEQFAADMGMGMGMGMRYGMPGPLSPGVRPGVAPTVVHMPGAVSGAGMGDSGGAPALHTAHHGHGPGHGSMASLASGVSGARRASLKPIYAPDGRPITGMPLQGPTRRFASYPSSMGEGGHEDGRATSPRPRGWGRRGSATGHALGGGPDGAHDGGPASPSNWDRARGVLGVASAIFNIGIGRRSSAVAPVVTSASGSGTDGGRGRQDPQAVHDGGQGAGAAAGASAAGGADLTALEAGQRVGLAPAVVSLPGAHSTSPLSDPKSPQPGTVHLPVTPLAASLSAAGTAAGVVKDKGL